ncbi:hypothetical protein HKD37_17G047425 [Glycine soja]
MNPNLEIPSISGENSPSLSEASASSPFPFSSNLPGKEIINIRYFFLRSYCSYSSLPLSSSSSSSSHSSPHTPQTLQTLPSPPSTPASPSMPGLRVRMGFFVDVGANVGMASFAASAMGFRVLAFEPVFENLQRICEGVYFNRVADLVTIFEAAASDRVGNITVHKLVGRLDNSAISATGAKLAFKSNEEIAFKVRTVPLDEVISKSERVLLLKIDVQGWEYHVLKGASKLLSRKGSQAPYLIYEEDERLLQASNSSAKEIRDFLHSVGYHDCTQHGTDAHCIKKD